MALTNEHHIRLFNRIVFGYQWFFRTQVRGYRRILKKNIEKLEVVPGATILDVGCGTGAFAKAFQEQDFDVVGVDGSKHMVTRAEKNGIQGTHEDFLNGLDYPSNHFDLVIAANVAHGLKPEDRIKLYQEMLRVSKGRVLIHDYNQKNLGLSKNSLVYSSDYYYCDCLKG